jgi:hypothetical protein
VCVVPGSTPGVAAGQGRSLSLAKRQGLQVSSSVAQGCMPWMAAHQEREEDRDGGYGLRGLKTVRDGAGLATLGRAGQEGPRAVLSCARRRRLLVLACWWTARFHVDMVGFCAP